MKILIIGAGASGLMAAKHLAESGNEVIILEARERIGGRIQTFYHNDFTMEGGAEFIHGKLPVTLDLLKEAGIGYTKTSGAFWQCQENEWKQSEQIFEHESLLDQKLKELKENISIEAFLHREFRDKKYAGLRQSVLSYIQGYYAADPARMSALIFYKEWKSEEEQQYRVEGGYGKMIDYLESKIVHHGGKIFKSTIVKEISWQKGKVTARDSNDKEFTGDKIIVTIPVGVWQNQHLVSSLSFVPAIDHKYEAAQKLGFGNVVKILLLFTQPFWRNDPIHERLHADIGDFGFVFSDREIPTFWTQTPANIPLLTGWLAGPSAKDLSSHNDEALIDKAITSLSEIFSIEKAILQMWLEWSKVFNWPADPFTMGGYSYSTIASIEARKEMMEPIEGTLFFAGESLYEGTETGTVEAALTSGIVVARQLMLENHSIRVA